MSVAASRSNPLIESLIRLVGDEHVLTDDESTTLYAQDIYSKTVPALAVARPENTEQLAGVVRAAVDAGHAVIARGGGMSYTGGYVPKEAGSVVIDMRRMDQVLEINTEDMYVTVQSGCTWKMLHDALSGTGLRTPFWGTLSGIRASIGGGMSQNCIFWGSARYGSAVDSVLGLEVVLADGSVVRTGAQAQRNSTPFFRHYGPDLTGLFTCDTGALGFKATVTLQLVPERNARRYASYGFEDYASTVAAMSEIGRAGIADEVFAFDPYLQQVRMQRESLVSDAKKLAGVAAASGGVLDAIKDSAKIALAGRRFMKDVQYSLHVMVEERVDAAAEESIGEAKRICAQHGGNELADSIPKILRANPFTPLNNVVGPNGERWTPVHTIVPHSRALETLNKVNALFDEQREEIDRLGIGVGFLLALISNNGFVIEPVFFTPDAMAEIHEDTIEESVLRSLSGFADNPEARALTAKLRAGAIDVFESMGGVHMQIGKAYPYYEGLRPESWRVVEGIKQTVDPEGRINPGSLGLE